MRYLLLGGAGILGSGFVDAIGRRTPNAQLRRLSPDWTKPSQATLYISRQLPELLSAGDSTTVVWAAGVGQIGTSREDMAAERTVLGAVADSLVSLPAGRQRTTRLIFASSAGGLFGGNDGELIDESSQPAPISEYGFEKLGQEQICRSITSASEVGVLICRFSNLYGLASGRLPAKGLIPAAIQAARLRQPMTIYVTRDTRRDYLYGADAAGMSLELAEGLAGSPLTALVAQGTTTTVGEIVTVVGRVLKRHVPATFAERPETSLQPRSLKFSPRESVAGSVARTPMAVAINRMAHAPIG